MKVGDVIELRAQRFDKGANVVGEHDGTTVLATGLLPGELGRVSLEHVGKQRRAYGKAIELVEPSAHRRAPPCPHQGECGGCPLMIADEGFVASAKRERLAQLGLVVDDVVRADRSLGYRWSSKRVVGAGGAVGSYRPGTHELAPMRGCLVDHPEIAACFDELEASGGCDGLRYAWAKINAVGQVLLTLVLDSETASADELAGRLKRPVGIASCVQDGEGNAMRGRDVRHLRGERSIAVELCGVTVEIGPLGFLQPNPTLVERAYPELVSDRRGALAFDLYAGAGVTTHLLRQRYEEVRCCESSEESAAALGIAPLSAEDFLRAQTDAPDLIVANPPRAGLGPAVCEAIVAMALRRDAPMRLHLMSCELRALVRDLERLTEAGTFTRVGARAYDTLPQTAHIEVIAWLQRN